MVVLALVSLMVQLVVRMLSGKDDEGDPGVQPRRRRLRSWLHPVFNAVVIVFTVSIAAYTLLFTSGYFGVFILGGISWVLVAFLFLVWRKQLRPFTVVTALIFILGPLFVSLVGLFGYIRGEVLLVRKSVAWELVVSSGEGSRTYELTGLRRFEAAVVAVELNRRIHVIPSAQVLHARQLDGPKDVVNICRWTGLYCKDEEPARSQDNKNKT
jgi:hypothetical protein